jgi:GTP-binding protein Era
VTLIGWTNVGKSTLINQLVGVKIAAVADAAQTTRHRITGVRNIDGRGQIVFTDTPGWHRPRHRMNRRMMNVTRQSLRDVDCVAWLLDASRGMGPGDREVVDLLRKLDTPRVAVLNKIDLIPEKATLLPLMEQIGSWSAFAEIVPLSAKSGDGCERLLEALLGLLPAGPPLFDEEFLTDQSQRQLVAEYVREQLVRNTREELPHSTAVTIDRWDDEDPKLLRIEATVLVDRESHKKIVIGKHGNLLKEVGTQARIGIEALLGCRVFLRLWVRVSPDWREDDATLREIGLG